MSKTRTGSTKKALRVLGFGSLLAVASVMFNAPAKASTIDDSGGYPIICAGPYGGDCVSGNTIFVGGRILPDVEPNDPYSGLESKAVVNIEAFDQSGVRIFQGTARTVRIVLSRIAYSFIMLPPTVTWQVPYGQLAWLEVWYYASGVTFQTADAKQLWVLINPPPPRPPCNNPLDPSCQQG